MENHGVRRHNPPDSPAFPVDDAAFVSFDVCAPFTTL